MNALNASFGFTISNGSRSLSLREGLHFRMYPTGKSQGFGEELTKRQIDLLRISMAIHVADGWVRRDRATNRYRQPVIDVEVLDEAFWSRPATLELLKMGVDFLSGGEDWSFCFIRSQNTRHERHLNLFCGRDTSALVSLYSGGLDSAAGLALRLAMMPGRMMIPVTIRHQLQKARLVRDHFTILRKCGLTNRHDLKPFQVGAFVRNARIRREFGASLRESTHRCRPMLFMAVAGLVADIFNSAEVEVFESGVGSINLPLVSGPADYRTTRSTHPHFLRLISALVSYVNDSSVRYVLPFADHTKAEMVRRVKELGLGELARRSVSCILHPLRRQGWQQCGYCPACVYRRQAMITAGIEEGPDAYEVDLFSPPEPIHNIRVKHLLWIRAFHQQAGRLAELDEGRVPNSFQRYLYATQAVSTDDELSPHIKVYRRYQQEWAALIAASRRRGLPWVTPSRSLACVSGATQ